MDKRIQKSLIKIEDAFLSLTKEKGFHKVTVRDIVTQVTINKSTFYDHFTDKYDLLHSYERLIMHSIEESLVQMGHFHQTFISRSQAENSAQLQLILNGLYQKLFEQQQIVDLLLDYQNDNSFSEQLEQKLKEFVSAYLNQLKKQGPLKVPEDFATQLMASNYLNMIHVWRKTNWATTPKDLASLMIKYLYQTVSLIQ